MPLSGASRGLLAAATANLGAAGALVVLAPESGVLSAHWSLLVWLLLIGFISCTTTGFSLHLFPTVSRRLLPRWLPPAIVAVTLEASVVLGSYALALPFGGALERGLFEAAAVAFLLSIALVFLVFLGALAAPRLLTATPEARPGDVVTVALFLAAWTSALGAGTFFLLSNFGSGPGFGWWLAGVHLFVLGHATLLVAAVSLRLVPRSLGSDPPRAAGLALAGLGATGAAAVPLGMLLVSPLDASPLDASPLVLFAAPEAAFAALFLGLLVYLGVTARTPRPQLALHLMAVMLLLLGGGLGLWMVAQSDFRFVVAHAAINVLGFLGLTIVIMWFAMIAPFQRVSHAWSRRMLWGLASVWLFGVTAFAALGSDTGIPPPWLSAVAGATLLAATVVWGAGTFPVLFPRLNPLPGVREARIRAIRDRWGER